MAQTLLGFWRGPAGAAGVQGEDGLGLNPRGEWIAAGSYRRNDVVVYTMPDSSETRMYGLIADGPFTSSVTPPNDPDHWALMLVSARGPEGSSFDPVNGIRWARDWVGTSAYTRGDLVLAAGTVLAPGYEANILARCFVDIPAPTTGFNANPWDDQARWEIVYSGTSVFVPSVGSSAIGSVLTDNGSGLAVWSPPNVPSAIAGATGSVPVKQANGSVQWEIVSGEGGGTTLPSGGSAGQVLKLGPDGTTLTWAADIDTNTTYPSMSAANANAGTANTPSVVTAAVLRGAIRAHAVPSDAAVAIRVAVPATATSAGAVGNYAVGGGYVYFYTGDGTTHSWVRTTAGTW